MLPDINVIYKYFHKDNPNSMCTDISEEWNAAIIDTRRLRIMRSSNSLGLLQLNSTPKK